MNNKLFTTLTIAFLFLSAIVFAQAPQAFSYQAIAANANGTPVANGTVAVRISVLDNSATGTVLYTETHSKQTNAQGLFNLNIGQGSPTAGTFSGINWGQNAKYVKVELDPAGGTNYVNVGTNQLMSVPYALYADKTNPSNISTTVKSTDKEGEITVVYTSTNAYGFYKGNTSGGYWVSEQLSGTPLGAVASGDGIVVYTTTNAYGFYKGNTSGGYWVSEQLSGTAIGALASDSCIVVYTNTNAYGFYKGKTSGGYWVSEQLSGTPIGSGNSKNTVVVYTNSNAYGFYKGNTSGGYWVSESLSGTPIKADGSKDAVIVLTSSNAYSFYKGVTSGGYWVSESLSGTPIDLITR